MITLEESQLKLNKMSIPNLLNLGCGGRFRDGWVNVNFTSSLEGVIAANLAQGIPFPDESFDVVYHSHLLEHFPKAVAPQFLRECYRVLRPKGIIRMVVPNLEDIARNYIFALDQARAGSTEWSENYEWLLIEMYDQVARNQTGGGMADYLFSVKIDNEAFVIQRCGVEASRLIEAGKTLRIVENSRSGLSKAKMALRTLRNPRELLLRLLLGEEYEVLKIGRFRVSGENHQWMYDSYSLTKMLTQCGFTDVVVRSALDSYVPDWSHYNLDTEPDGSIYKPDSLFIEAIKS